METGLIHLHTYQVLSIVVGASAFTYIGISMVVQLIRIARSRTKKNSITTM